MKEKFRKLLGCVSAALNSHVFKRTMKTIFCLLILNWWILSILKLNQSDSDKSDKIIICSILLVVFCLLFLVSVFTRKTKAYNIGKISGFMAFCFGYCSKFYCLLQQDSPEFLFWGLHSVWYYIIAKSFLKFKTSFALLIVVNTLAVVIQIMIAEYSKWNFLELTTLMVALMFAATCKKLGGDKEKIANLIHEQRVGMSQDSTQIKINDTTIIRNTDDKKLSGFCTEGNDQARGILMMVPQGIIIFNEKMEIQSSNYSARRILNLDEGTEISPAILFTALKKVSNLKIRRECSQGNFRRYLDAIAKQKAQRSPKPSRRVRLSGGSEGQNTEQSPGLPGARRRTRINPFKDDIIDTSNEMSPTKKNLLGSPFNDQTIITDSNLSGGNSPQIRFVEESPAQDTAAQISFFELFEYIQANQISLVDTLKCISNQKENILIDGNFEFNLYGEFKVLEFGLFTLANAFPESGGRIILTIDDITMREVITVAENNSQFKENLISSFSHELRTPLNQTIIFLECAHAATEIPQETRLKYVTPALRGCKLLLNTVKDILDLSQLHTQNLQVCVREFSLKKVIEDCIDLFAADLKSKQVTLEFAYDSQLPEIINSDSDRICQIVINLLSNALKFTNPNGKISVTCSKISSGARIVVSDNGLGMNLENQKRLIESFKSWELAQRVSTHSAGAGFGLYTANQLALLLGASDDKGLCIKSEEGCGSTFSFEVQNRSWVKNSSAVLVTPTNKITRKTSGYIQYSQFDKRDTSPIANFRKSSFDSAFSLLNLAPSKKFRTSRPSSQLEEISDRSEESETIFNEDIEEIQHVGSIDIHSSHLKKLSVKGISSAAHLKPQPSSCKCNKVMIVDDDGSNIAAIEMLLSHFKISADKAYNGREALNKYRERIGIPCGKQCEPYRLIFMDINMPQMNGIEATNLIRNLQKVNKLPHVSIIGCTAYVQSEMSSCLEAGMDTCYQKPIMMTTMKEILGIFLHSPETRNHV